MSNKGKTIWISDKTYEKLERLKDKLKAESPNELVHELIEVYYGKEEEEQKQQIVEIPNNEELYENLIEAIEEAGPPSEFRLLLPYIMLGLIAGLGLGIYLAFR